MPIPYPSNIITAEHLPKVNAEIAQVKAAINEQNLAMRAGIGDPAMTDKLTAKLNKLALFKSVYFPGQ